MRVVGVTGGVDTHADVHVAAAIDDNGGLLGVESFPATEFGFEGLLGWLVGFGTVVWVGVEDTGSWGVGLTRFLTGHDVTVVEVDRPNRQQRRRVGKSDPTDVISAARLRSPGQPRSLQRVGTVESRRCVCSWWPAAGPANNVSNRSTSYVTWYSQHQNPSGFVSKTGIRPGWSQRQQTCGPREGSDPIVYTTYLVIRSLARRIKGLDAEMKEIDQALHSLFTETAPTLL
ncbi:MAG: transposase [Acidimicrobiia bacterium]